MLQRCQKRLHLCVVNINFAKSAWKQAQIAYDQRVSLITLTTVNHEWMMSVTDCWIFLMLLEATLTRTTY